MNNFVLKNVNLFNFKNGKLNYDGLKNITVKDGKINENADTAGLKIIDVEGRVGFHGLTNFHHHIYSQLSKGMPVSGDFSNFVKILENMWWKLDKVLFKEAVEYSTSIAALDCIKNGVTTVFDHHASFDFIKGSLSTMGDILEKFGLDNVMCFETSDRNGEAVLMESVEENIDYINKIKNNSKRKAMFGLHAPFTLSDKSLKIIREKTPENTGFHYHLAEDIADVKASLEINKIDIVDRMIGFDMVNSKTILGHCNHLTSEQFSKLDKFGPAIAHNPESNMNNAVGAVNYKLFEKMENIKFIPGTDGMSANVLKSMKTAFLLYRHNNKNSEIGFELFDRMLRNSAQFMETYFPGSWNMNSGSVANITVFDYIPYTPLTLDNFMGHLIYGITETRPYTVIKEKLLLSEGKITFADEAEICRQAVKISEKLWGKL